MKVAFFGTSDRTTPILNSLKDNFDLTLCVTKTDSRMGRKQEFKETMVKTWAKANAVPFLEITSAKRDAENIKANIQAHTIELGVVADFGFIIPQELIAAFPKGLINVHFSLLPKYRGASPVQTAILNGDEITGITYYLLDQGLDTGCIIEQNEYKIGKDETADTLYTRLFDIAGSEIASVIEKYVSGKTIPYSQDNSSATYTHSRTHPDKTLVFKEDAQLNWQEPAEKIARLIRAFTPWPIAWTYLGELAENLNYKLKNSKTQNLLVKIYKAHVENQTLVVDKLQVEGKSEMLWQDFKNGYLA